MRALLVYKKSQFQLYSIDRKSPELKSLALQNDPMVEAMRLSHDVHLAAIDRCAKSLRDAGYKVQRTYRARLGDLKDFDLIVTVGGDGTLLDVSHHIDHPIDLLGVNSDPLRSVGMLTACDVDSLDQRLQQIATHDIKPIEVTRIRLRINGQRWPQLALNDVLVSHRIPAATSRYELSIGQHHERHTCSGLWIASAVGSTGAIRGCGGEIRPLVDPLLQFRVREANPARDGMLLKSGLLKRRQTLHLRSLMRDGKIYIDGPHLRIPFPLGSRLDLEPVPNSLRLFVHPDSQERRGEL